MECIICKKETGKSNKKTCSAECKKESLRRYHIEFYHANVKEKKVKPRTCETCGASIPAIRRKRFCDSCAYDRRKDKERNLYNKTRDQEKYRQNNKNNFQKREEMRKKWRVEGLCSNCGSKRDRKDRAYCQSCRDLNSKIHEKARREEGVLPSGQSQHQQGVYDVLCSLVSHEVKYNDRSTIVNPKTGFGLELDIYVPSMSLAIEVDGVFHRRAVYGEERFIKQVTNDKIKDELCQKNNINLIRISTDDIDEYGYEWVKAKLEEII